MKITRIKTSNFRQHKNVDIDLSSDQSDFVVIKGNMGAGKTNLLKAVTWSIYGDADGSANSAQEQLLSDSVVSSLGSGEYGDTEVRIEISIDQEDVFISRKQTFQKTSSDIKPYGDSELTVQVKRSTESGYQVEPNPQGWIEKYLPRRFRPYFLFDGERLERFLQDSDAPKIRAAIQEVARIDVLHRIQEKLGNASDTLNQKAARLVGIDGEKLAQDLGELVKKFNGKEDEVKKLEAKLQQATDAEQSLDEKLGEQANLEANINRKRMIDTELDNGNHQLSAQKIEFNLKARKLAPVVLMAPALKCLGIKIEEARANKVLPPPVNLEFLSQLLKDKLCICGSDLSASSDHARHIERVISEYAEVSEIGEALNEHSTIHAAELSKLPSQSEVVDQMNLRIIDKEEEMRVLQDEQSSLALELENLDDEMLSTLAVARKEQKEICFRTRRSLEVAKAELIELRSKKTDLEKAIAKASSANEEATKARDKAAFARKSADTARDLYETMNNRVRETVSNSLEDKFKTMTWKKGYFASICIDPEFRVSVLNNQGIESYRRLSAGETVCLAFAFSLTLSKEAGLSFPIMVDTPMGRLSPEVQENLAKVIADATIGSEINSNHQIILLMTETEYNPRVAKMLSTRHPKILDINFDTETSESDVK